jgi:membrane protein DedA with SNARE-associated domain/membrane-associated phospholipid phosphatase
MKPVWLVGAAVLAAFLLIRRRTLGRTTQLAGWVVVLAAAAVGAGLIHLPNLEHTILKVGEALGPWTYLLVGALAFLETGAFIGLIAPGETAVIVGGLVAGQGKISLPVLIAIVWACAVAGDVTSFTLGKRLGRGFLLRHGARLKITDERLKTVEGFFQRRGGATILVGRFIGFVRPLAPFVAGTARMPTRTFLSYDVLGAGLWSATFCVLGYVFWRSFTQLTAYVSRGLFAVGALAALGAAIWYIRDEERRERLRTYVIEHTPAPLRGAFSLELVTLLALLAVGGYTFFLVGQVVGHGGLHRADDAAFRMARDLSSPALVSVAKVVTNLGSSPVTALVALATAIGVGVRRRYIDAGMLVAGWVLSYAAAHIAKAAYDRPRPAGALIDTSLSSYPSGHAVYSVTLVACATVLVRAGTGWAMRISAVTVALVLVVLVCLTRVYLRAHFLSDVVGGVALGTAVWALCGSVALVIAHVRHNMAAHHE